MRRVALADLDPAGRRALLRRSAVPDPEVRAGATLIVADVRQRGDAALDATADRYGGGRPGDRRVAASEMASAWASLGADLREAIRHAAANITRFHQAQAPADFEMEVEPGVRVARRWSPLRRVGAYVPGGAAAYPSTLLMTMIPAQIAGVPEIAVASPAGPGGSLSPALLGAAHFLGVGELWVMGGAQAVAALAYGTETIAAVDKIVGPGNAWVTAAKLAVFGDVDVDMPAGPSEVVVVADATANPTYAAADLLSQAEHGPDSPAVLVTDDPGLIDAVAAEVVRLLPALERQDVLAKALADHGMLVLAADHADALDFAAGYAAEHVTLLTADPAADAAALTAAGSVFAGPWAPEPVGDYASGANHVLPTGGLAAAMSPLGVESFGSWRQVQTLTEEGLAALRGTIGELATAEGLTAHRLAVEVRFGGGP